MPNNFTDFISSHDEKINSLPSLSFYRMLYGTDNDNRMAAKNIYSSRVGWSPSGFNEMSLEEKQNYLLGLTNSTLGGRYKYDDKISFLDNNDIGAGAHYSPRDRKAYYSNDALKSDFASKSINTLFHEYLHGSQDNAYNNMLSLVTRQSPNAYTHKRFNDNINEDYYNYYVDNSEWLSRAKNSSTNESYKNMGEYLSRAGEIEARVLAAAEMAKQYPDAPMAAYGGYPTDIILGENKIREMLDLAGYVDEIADNVWGSIATNALRSPSNINTSSSVIQKMTDDAYDKYYNDLNSQYKSQLSVIGSLVGNETPEEFDRLYIDALNNQSIYGQAQPSRSNIYRMLDLLFPNRKQTSNR